MISTVITLTPPYGTLMMLAATHPELGKHIETRNWATKYRGRLLIHQGSNLLPVAGLDGLRELCLREPFKTALRAAGYDLDQVDVDALPRGAILGSVELCAVVSTEQLVRRESWTISPHYWELCDQELAFGDYLPRRYGWLCADARPLAEPIPARGYPGLWTWEGQLP